MSEQGPPEGEPVVHLEDPETPDGPLEDPDMPDRTQNDAPDASGVEHGSEEEPDDR